MMAAIVRAFGRAWRPLVFYYGIAVAAPVLNGATLDRVFLEHVAFVLAVPLVMVTAAGGAARLASLCGQLPAITRRRRSTASGMSVAAVPP